jgi:hypothetical protein
VRDDASAKIIYLPRARTRGRRGARAPIIPTGPVTHTLRRSDSARGGGDDDDDDDDDDDGPCPLRLFLSSFFFLPRLSGLRPNPPRFSRPRRTSLCTARWARTCTSASDPPGKGENSRDRRFHTKAEDPTVPLPAPPPPSPSPPTRKSPSRKGRPKAEFPRWRARCLRLLVQANHRALISHGSCAYARVRQTSGVRPPIMRASARCACARVRVCAWERRVSSTCPNAGGRRTASALRLYVCQSNQTGNF